MWRGRPLQPTINDLTPWIILKMPWPTPISVNNWASQGQVRSPTCLILPRGKPSSTTLGRQKTVARGAGRGGGNVGDLCIGGLFVFRYDRHINIQRSFVSPPTPIQGFLDSHHHTIPLLGLGEGGPPGTVISDFPRHQPPEGVSKYCV